MKLRPFGLGIFLAFAACSTTSKQTQVQHNNRLLIAPPIEIAEGKDPKSVALYLASIVKDKNQYRAERVWAKYKLAQLTAEMDSKKSCLLYTELSKEKDFPLHDLSYLHALNTCDISDNVEDQLKRVEDLSKNPWYSNLALEVKLRIAKNAKDPSRLIDAYIEKSKLPLNRNEKVKYTLKALRLSRKQSLHHQVQAMKKRLYKLAPRLMPHPRPQDYLRVAYDYRRVRQFNKAIRFYKKILRNRHSSFSLRLFAVKGIARSHKLKGDKIKYLTYSKVAAKMVYKNFRKHPKNKKAIELLSDLNIKLARTYWTQGHIKSAKKALYKLSLWLKGKASRAKVFWIYGRMAEEKRHFKRALWWFDQALAEDFQSDDFRDVVKWYKAWNLRKIGKNEDAATILADLVKTCSNIYNKPKYQYWLAKTDEQLKRYDEAKLIYQDLINDDPLGFYGLLAHRETQELLRVFTDKQSHPQGVTEADKTLLAKMLDVPYIEWLISVDENALANSYLDAVSANYHKTNDLNSDDNTWIALFHYYAKAGSYLSLFTQLGHLDEDQRRAILAKNPELIFPRPFFNSVSDSANRFGLSTEFIYSIMRQESAFNPRARSHMDAFGLMQLLPKVARKSARKNHIPFHKTEDLYKPNIAIMLGAAHLRQLWDKHGGQLILTTASYNANTKTIEGWLKTRYRGDPLEFIEDIPYEETRNYIKLVIRNLVFYKVFNSTSEAISFPEWALNLDG